MDDHKKTKTERDRPRCRECDGRGFVRTAKIKCTGCHKCTAGYVDCVRALWHAEMIFGA